MTLDRMMRNPFVAGLNTEQRVGVQHFVPGQIKAWCFDDEELRVLRFVSGMGHAWIVCLEADGDNWRAMMAMEITPSGLSRGWQGVPTGFRLTPGIVAALDNPEPLPEA